MGVHPVLTQVPPMSLRSIRATFMPAPARRPARNGPACPAPMIIASNDLGTSKTSRGGETGKASYAAFETISADKLEKSFFPWDEPGNACFNDGIETVVRPDLGVDLSHRIVGKA